MKDILLCMYLCKLSYKDLIDDDFIKTCEDYDIDWTQIEFIDKENTEAIVYQSNNKLYISLRGTDEIKDFLDDINFTMVPFIINKQKYGAVHKGFLTYAKRICEDINSCVERFMNNDMNNAEKEMIFTGHSLGAAICFQAMELAITKPYFKYKCITFGSPKLGDEIFTNYFFNCIKNSYRVYISNDVVTRLPFFASYKHLDHAIKLYDPRLITWKILVSSILTFYCCSGKLNKNNIFNEHVIDTYISKYKEQVLNNFKSKQRKLLFNHNIP